MGVVENLISELSTARGDRRVRIFVILKMSCLLSQLTLSVTLFGAVACARAALEGANVLAHIACHTNYIMLAPRLVACFDAWVAVPSPT